MRSYELRYLDLGEVKLPVLFLVDPNVEFVFVNGSTRLGRSNELVIESAHFLEHFALRGTKSFPTKEELRDAISDVGGRSNGKTSDLNTSYIAWIPHDHIEVATKVICDILFGPILSPEDVEIEKHAIEVELGKKLKDFPYKLHVLFAKAMFKEGTVGYRDFIEDRLKSLENISYDDIKKVYEDNYAAENLVLAFGGNVDPNKIMNLLKDITKDVKQKAHPELRPESIVEYTHTSITDDVHAEFIMMGFKGPQVDHVDYPAMQILRFMLSGKPTARLRHRLREIENIAYSPYSWVTPMNGMTKFYVYSDAKKGEVDKAEQCIIEELLRLRNEGPAEREFQLAKQAIVGMMKTKERISDHIYDLVDYYMITGKLKEAEIFADSLKQVTLEDVKKVAKKYIPEEFKKENYASAKIIAKS